MKLIRYLSRNSELNFDRSVTPRWIYETRNNIIKTIPYTHEYERPPVTVRGARRRREFEKSKIEQQIKLVNKICGFKFISNYQIEKKSEVWTNKHQEPNNTYLTYHMEKLNWLYNPSGKRESKRSENMLTYMDSELKHIDGILKYILPLYVNITLKTFPYGNTDLAHGNTMIRDNGDICLIDWDDCILGIKRNADYFAESFILECGKAHFRHKFHTFDKSEIKNVIDKTIDVYKKLVENTKLSKFQIYIDDIIDRILMTLPMNLPMYVRYAASKPGK